ncbi:MAG TPA: FliH/SctL family protein, partial [bacterium]|nr:FliH/SctL family protein [bacterium]
HHQMVLDLAQEVIKKAQDQVHLKLHLNPEDVEEVEAQKEQLQLSVGAGELEIVPDARIERGGCVLETEAGSVDARLSTVVEQIKGSLSEGMSQK